MAAATGTHIVDEKSFLACPSELDIFSVPVTQAAIVGGHWSVVRCKNLLDNNGPWSFEMESGGHYCQPSKNYLYLKLKLVRVQNIPLDNLDIVAPINKIGSTFFKTMKLYIGSKQVSDSYDLYPYRCMLETELNYGPDVKNSGHLKASLYAQDRPPEHLDDEQNVGFIWRKKWFDDSKEVELMTPLACDLFNTERVLPTHTRMRIELYRNQDAFCLMEHNAAAQVARRYQLQVVQMDWYVRMVDLSTSAHLALEAALLRTPAKYPVRLTKLTRLSVASGANRTPQNTLFNGQIPRRLVIGAVERAAFNGDLKKNPFHFQPFNIEEITVTAGGIRYDQEPLRTDFTGNIYLRAYLQLLDTMGMGAPSNQSCGIPPDLYKNGLTLFAFNLSADLEDGDYWGLARSGPTYMEARFGQALATDIEFIVYAEFDSLIRIDCLREPHLAHMI